MEDFVFKNKRMYISVAALWLNVITWVEVVIVRGHISIKGSLITVINKNKPLTVIG